MYDVKGYSKGAHLAVSFRQAFKRAMIATCGIAKQGAAPREHLERQVEGGLKRWQRARG